MKPARLKLLTNNSAGFVKRTIILMMLYTVILSFAPIANLPRIVAQTASKTERDGIDKGDFKVGFSPVTLKKNPKKIMNKEVADSLLELTKPLNEVIALPYDVYLNFDECGEPNAFYNSTTREVTMCYEFLNEFEEAFKKVSDKQDEIDSMTENAMIVFLFHELGHCLIDVWDLPTTGREEDTVDQLAMFILLDGTPEGEQMVLSAATFFAIVSEQKNTDELAFWDEHSLDQQRFYDMLCLTYGSNPSKNKELLGKDGLPPERAQGCPAEFQKVDRTWRKLLAPYLKS
jgi:Putative metallopeptidase